MRLHRESDDVFSWYACQHTRTKKSEKRKHIFSFGYVQRMEVSDFTGRAEEMQTSANFSQRIAQGA